ncbi:tryptophan synthase subunit alpha [Polluticaenibacter yanchengensis]|uniref:Tryptophan synthase alpha chain n=1 Tax=Polluticaenibacter yanchengensis TaxID=3014562 RepID=A0ABT4UL20_9BACT|nr:tryptophan synthase subunit alpha [Chitinophagaceae bacterium LY-5]
MSLEQLFIDKPKNILSIYYTAGYPNLEDTVPMLEVLQKNGVDLIELGMPFSDPLADGPTIQNSSLEAINNGMTVKKLFEQLENFREKVTVPVILMGYMNTVLQYGFEAFCEDAASVGINGLILPDMPKYEFEKTYKAVIEKHGLKFIFLVTPETSVERVLELDKLSSGFIYAVSSSSTTGTDKDMDLVKNYLQKLNSLNLKNPVVVGFGIKDKESFNDASEYANGAIIGSAFVKQISSAKDRFQDAEAFIKSLF